MIEWFHNYSFYQIALNEVIRNLELDDMLFFMILTNEGYLDIGDIQKNSIQIIETRKVIIEFLKKCGISSYNISLDQSYIELEDGNEINIPFERLYYHVNCNKVIENIKREALRIYTTLLLANFEQLHTEIPDLVKKINLYVDSDIYKFTSYDRNIIYNKKQMSEFHINSTLNALWRRGILTSDIEKIKHTYLTPDLYMFGIRVAFAEIECENKYDSRLIYRSKIGHSIDKGDIMEAYSGQNVNIEFQPAIIDKNDPPFTTTLKYEYGNMDKFLTELNFYLSSDKYNYNIEYLCSYIDDYKIVPEWYNDKKLVFCSDD